MPPVFSFPFLILFLSLLTLLSPYPASNTFTHFLADRGRHILPTPLPSSPFAYTLTFLLPFTSTPTILITLANLQYCPSNLKQSFDLSKSQLTTLTTTTITTEWLYPSSLSKLVINYLAFDPAHLQYLKLYQTNHRIWDHTMWGNNDKQNKQVIDVDGYNATDDNVKILCFLQMSKGVKQKGDTYEVIVECGVKGRKEIEVKVRCTEDYEGLDEGVGWITVNYKLFTVNTLVVLDREQIILEAGTLSGVNNIGSAPLTIASPPFEFLIIGIRSWKVETRCLHFGLNTLGTQLTEGTGFHSVNYDYYTIIKKGGELVYLRTIATNFYSTSVFLNYHGFTNNISKAGKGMFELKAGDVLELDSGSDGAAVGGYNVKTIARKPLTNADVEVVYRYSFVTEAYEKKTVFRVVGVTEMVLYAEERVVKVNVINARNSTPANFIHYNTTALSVLNTTQSSGNTTLFLTYTDTVYGAEQVLQYQDPTHSDNIYISFTIPRLAQIATSIKTNTATITITDLKKVADSPTSQFKVKEQIGFTKDVKVDKVGSGVEVGFEYYGGVEKVREGVVRVEYVWYGGTGWMMGWEGVKVGVATHLLHTVVPNVFELTVVGLWEVEKITKERFTTSQAGVVFKEVRVVDTTDLVLVIETDPATLGDLSYAITYTPLSPYTLSLQHITTTPRFLNFTSTQYQNNLDILFHNPALLTNSTLPTITTTHPSITIKQTLILPNNLIFIHAAYNDTVDSTTLSLHYNENTTFSLYHETINIHLQYEFPLVFCIGTLDTLSRLYTLLAQTLQYSYLAIFVLSLVFMNKLAGVEMIFLIQFAYYSMITIGLNCPYVGVKEMKYVRGYNPLFQGMDTRKISFELRDLGISSAFLSNVNCMVMVLAVCPVMFAVLMWLGKRSECYRKKPRYIRYGKAFAFEVPLTVMLFNSFNVYNSLVVEWEYYNGEGLVSLAVGVVCGLMLPAYTLIYFFFPKQFSEYREQLQTTQKIRHFTRETSIRLRQLYPLLLSLEFILTPILLSLPALSTYTLYILLVLSLLISTYSMFTTPYLHKINNIRLLLHRIILLALITNQSVWKVLAKEGVTDGGFIFYIPMVMFGLLGVGLLVDGGGIVRGGYLWVRKRGVIDHGLKMRKEATKTKPEEKEEERTKVGRKEERWYPKLQFGQYKREQIALLRKNVKFNFTVEENLLGATEEEGENFGQEEKHKEPENQIGDNKQEEITPKI